MYKRHGKIRVVRADNDVVKGIRKTSDALKSGRIKICKPCRDAIREFSLYRWDESAKYDAPRKENDHAMDDIRYFVMSLENSADGFCRFGGTMKEVIMLEAIQKRQAH